MNCTAYVETREQGKNYCWLVVAVTCGILFCNMGIIASSIHGSYLISEVGLSNVQNSMLISVRLFFCLIGSALCGVYFSRLSLHAGLTLSMVMGTASYALFAIAGDYPVFLAAAALSGMTQGFGGSIGTSVLIKNWFVKKQSFAFGVTAAASGLCSVILPGLVRNLTESASLRTAFLAETGIFAAVALVTFLVIRDRPEQIGLRAYGAESGNMRWGNEHTETVGEVRKTSKQSFVLLAVMFILSGGQIYATWIHFSVLFSTAGFPSSEYTVLLSIGGAALMAGKILYGLFTDRFGSKSAFYLFCPIQMAGLLLNCCAVMTGSFAVGVIGSILEGGAGVITTVGMSSMAADLYPDSEDFKKKMIWFTCIHLSGSLIFSTLFGVTADLFSSYVPIFAVCALLGAVNMVLVKLAYKGVRS